MLLRRSRERQRDLAAVTALAILWFVVSFTHVSKPFCDGQPHSLPEDSPAVRNYPCSGSRPARIFHIFRYAPRVFQDLTGLKYDLWISFTIYAMAVRTGCALLMPDPLYTSSLAPLLTYAARIASSFYHVCLGPSYTPTAFSALRLFTVHAPADIFLFIALQPISEGSSRRNELLYGLLNTVFGALLCSWYRGRPQPYLHGLSITRVVIHRLLATCTNLFLLAVFRRRHQLQQQHRQQATRLSTSLQGGSSSSKGVGLNELGSQGKGDSAAAVPRNQAGSELKPSSRGAAGAGAAKASGSDDSCGILPDMSKGPERTDEAQKEAGRGRVETASNSTAPDAPRTCSLSAAPHTTGTAAVATTTAAGPCLPCPLPEFVPHQPRYRRYHSFTRRSVHYAKIEGVDPEQLHPEWRQRLGGVMAQQGLVLVGAYVRRGCIELLLEVGELPDRAQGAGGDSSRGAAGVDVLGVAMRALELPPSAVPTTLFPEALGDCPALPRILSVRLQPRVLLLPQPGQRQQPEQQTAEQVHAVAVVPGLATAPPLSFHFEVEMEVGNVGRDAEEGATGAAAAASDAGASLMDSNLELLVRCHDAYMPARVQQSVLTNSNGVDIGMAVDGSATCTGSGDRLVVVRFDVELLPGETEGGNALLPGLAMVDLRVCGLPRCCLPLLLLPPEEAHVAAELSQLVQAAAGGGLDASDAGSVDGDAEDTVSALLYDLGTILYGRMQGLDTADLAAHLLSYAECSGLRHTAARVCAEVRARAGAAAAADPHGTAANSGSCESASALDAGPAAMAMVTSGTCTSPSPRTKDADAKGGCFASFVKASAPPLHKAPGSGDLGRMVWRAALLCAGLAREAPEEAREYQTYAATWTAAQAHIIQAVEVLALLTTLLRSRHSTSATATLIWVLRCGASVVTAISWPLLPYPAWRRLGAAMRLPRFAGALAAKGVKLLLRVPSPPGFARYQEGMGMVVMEGLLLPATCLLPPSASLLVSALRLALNAAAINTAFDPSYAAPTCPATAQSMSVMFAPRGLLLAARVEAAALATTAACHTFLRVCCWRGRQRRERRDYREREHVWGNVKKQALGPMTREK